LPNDAGNHESPLPWRRFSSYHASPNSDKKKSGMAKRLLSLPYESRDKN
jgi:hypothetical protein